MGGCTIIVLNVLRSRKELKVVSLRIVALIRVVSLLKFKHFLKYKNWFGLIGNHNQQGNDASEPVHQLLLPVKVLCFDSIRLEYELKKVQIMYCALL